MFYFSFLVIQMVVFHHSYTVLCIHLLQYIVEIILTNDQFIKSFILFTLWHGIP